jgi:lipopolysaccharide transport system ATP-binding protein
MGEPIIKIENLSKQYRLGVVGTGTLSHDLKRWWTMNIQRKEDPYLRIGETNDRSKKGESDYVWALKDINLEIAQGDVVGIIGKNGAGKSTLLKILSRVTKPTTGNIKYKGRIAALLEVGTGFHAEMTGRENIYMNGSIMGMTKSEIKRKLDEIVDFAGVERYIDTPVKRYSSGMTVRLGFSIAAHLEPDILVVDEVLAVGDAEFQKKAIGKMQDVSKAGGRTVLFVSHNMIAVKNLCVRGILLEEGRIIGNGPIDKIVKEYLEFNSFYSERIINQTKEGITLNKVSMQDNGIQGCFNIDEDLVIEVSLKSVADFREINVNLFFNAVEGGLIFATCTAAEPISTGDYVYKCIIPANTLNNINYSIDVMVVRDSNYIIHNQKYSLNVSGNEQRRKTGWLGEFPGLIRPGYFEWIRTKIQQ